MIKSSIHRFELFIAASMLCTLKSFVCLPAIFIFRLDAIIVLVMTMTCYAIPVIIMATSILISLLFAANRRYGKLDQTKYCKVIMNPLHKGCLGDKSFDSFFMQQVVINYTAGLY